MGEQAIAAIGAPADRRQAQSLDAMEQTFAQGQVVDRGRGGAAHAHMHMIGIVEIRPETGMRLQRLAIGQIDGVSGNVVDRRAARRRHRRGGGGRAAKRIEQTAVGRGIGQLRPLALLGVTILGVATLTCAEELFEEVARIVLRKRGRLSLFADGDARRLFSRRRVFETARGAESSATRGWTVSSDGVRAEPGRPVQLPRPAVGGPAAASARRSLVPPLAAARQPRRLAARRLVAESSIGSTITKRG